MHDSQMPEPDLISAAQSTLPPPEAPILSAGLLLRQAREAAHIHRVSLAGILKVPVKKIEAIENDDWDALPDLAFTRALASSICRQLKIDPQPVLALLPSVRQQAPQTPATLAEDKALEAARQKLSTSPTPRRRASGFIWATAGLFVLGAIGTAWWWQSQEAARHLAEFGTEFEAALPAASVTGKLAAADADAEITPSLTPSSMELPVLAASAPASSPASAAAVYASAAQAMSSAAMASLPVPQITAAAPVSSSTPVASLVSSKSAGLELQAQAESWVQVRDAQNKVQISRLLQAGERVQVQGQPPYRVWTGRAEALQIVWQGMPVAALQGKTGSLRIQIPPAAAPAVAAPPSTSPASLQR